MNSISTMPSKLDEHAYNKINKQHPTFIIKDSNNETLLMQPAQDVGVAINLAIIKNLDLSGCNIAHEETGIVNIDDESVPGLSRIGRRYPCLRDADIRGIDFSGGICWFGNFRNSDLRDSCLRNMLIRYAFFSGADLRGCLIPEAPVVDNIHENVHDIIAGKLKLDLRYTHISLDVAVVSSAGSEGARLEERHGLEAAAAFIYMASDPFLERLPDFWLPNFAAMAECVRLADEMACRQGNRSDHSILSNET